MSIAAFALFCLIALFCLTVRCPCCRHQPSSISGAVITTPGWFATPSESPSGPTYPSESNRLGQGWQHRPSHVSTIPLVLQPTFIPPQCNSATVTRSLSVRGVGVVLTRHNIVVVRGWSSFVFAAVRTTLTTSTAPGRWRTKRCTRPSIMLDTTTTSISV